MQQSLGDKDGRRRPDGAKMVRNGRGGDPAASRSTRVSRGASSSFPSRGRRRTWRKLPTTGRTGKGGIWPGPGRGRRLLAVQWRSRAAAIVSLLVVFIDEGGARRRHGDADAGVGLLSVKEKERGVRSGGVHGREEREKSTGRCETAWWLDVVAGGSTGCRTTRRGGGARGGALACGRRREAAWMQISSVWS